MTNINENQLEQTALDWFQSLGWQACLAGEPCDLVEEVFDVGFVGIEKKGAGFVLQFLRDVKAGGEL